MANRVPYVYQETGASRIVAGSTTTITVPDNLPVNRVFRPTVLRCEFVAHQAAGCIVQARALNATGETIAVFGPIAVGLSSRTLICRYPVSADNFSETTPKTKPIWAVDHICLSKASTDAVLLTNSTIWRFSREYQSEACPVRINPTVETTMTYPARLALTSSPSIVDLLDESQVSEP